MEIRWTSSGTQTAAGGIGSMSGGKAGKAIAEAGLGKDAFFELLVAQLRNQNPLEPMNDREFITQLAQFSHLEAAQANLELAEAQLLEQRLAADTLFRVEDLLGKLIQLQKDAMTQPEGE